MSDIKYGRKRKGIVKELNDKLNDWLETITDKKLVSLIRKDVVVTGGSITSMLMGDKVNDFDLYFKTKETTKLVAEYYVNLYNGNATTSIYNPVVKEISLPNCKGEFEDRITIYIKSSGVVEDNEEPQSEEIYDYVKVEEPQSEEKTKYRVSFMSTNAITLTNDIQIIIRFYGEPDKIHSNFDFQHAMCYFDYDKQKLELPGAALECMLSRSLIYKGSLYPIASIFRMKKFLERGWRITAGEQLKIMWQISELDLTDYEVLKEQLTGVDLAYLSALIYALKDVSSDKMNSTYVCEIIDRIFE